VLSRRCTCSAKVSNDSTDSCPPTQSHAKDVIATYSYLTCTLGITASLYYDANGTLEGLSSTGTSRHKLHSAAHRPRSKQVGRVHERRHSSDVHAQSMWLSRPCSSQCSMAAACHFVHPRLCGSRESTRGMQARTEHSSGRPCLQSGLKLSLSRGVLGRLPSHTSASAMTAARRRTRAVSGASRSCVGCCIPVQHFLVPNQFKRGMNMKRVLSAALELWI
jgi:hypothetical protein